MSSDLTFSSSYLPGIVREVGPLFFFMKGSDWSSSIEELVAAEPAPSAAVAALRMFFWAWSI